MKASHFGILAFSLSIALTAYSSEGVDDVIKLQRSGVDNDVIQAFVQDSKVAYDLSADDIQRLEDANVPATVIVGMLDHGKALRNEPVAAGADIPVSAGTQPFADAQPTAETVAVAPPEGEANISTFYESLAPYGTWSQDDNASWVWEPKDARDPNWRPYANNGHWTWTDHGWYFESSSPYGWAAYHYGRWGYNREHRWSWAPDNVWGPAWVDWRQSDENIGWAPLPFGSRFQTDVGFSFGGRNVGFDFHLGMNESEYCFVDSNRFLEADIGIVLVPENRRHEVYGRTKVINNTYVYNDNRIINNGVSTTVVERATKRKIEQVKVQDARIAAGQPIRGESRNANTISAYRPKIANTATVAPPAIVERQKAAAAARVNTKVEAATERKVVRQAAAQDKQAAQEAARTRLAAEKVQRQTVAAERKTATKTPAPANKEPVTSETDAQREERSESQAEKNREAKESQPAKAAPSPRATPNAADERKAANKEAAVEKKAAAKAESDAAREERSESKAEKAKEAKEGK